MFTSTEVHVHIFETTFNLLAMCLWQSNTFLDHTHTSFFFFSTLTSWYQPGTYELPNEVMSDSRFGSCKAKLAHSSEPLPHGATEVILCCAHTPQAGSGFHARNISHLFSCNWSVTVHTAGDGRKSQSLANVWHYNNTQELPSPFSFPSRWSAVNPIRHKDVLHIFAGS